MADSAALCASRALRTASRGNLMKRKTVSRLQSCGAIAGS